MLVMTPSHVLVGVGGWVKTATVKMLEDDNKSLVMVYIKAFSWDA